MRTKTDRATGATLVYVTVCGRDMWISAATYAALSK